MAKLVINLLFVGAVLTLSGCEVNKLPTVKEHLQAARKSGDLEQQKLQLQMLISTDEQSQQVHWQQQLNTVEKVAAELAKAQKLADTNPLAAMEIAAKADQQIFNVHSRQLVVDIIKPYRDFLPIYTPLREWAYTPFSKVVVPQLLGPGLSQWQLTAKKPSMWPDSNLMALLQSKNKRQAPLMAALVEEREALLEWLRPLIQLANKQPTNSKIQSLLLDGKAINGMYNVVTSDLHWHYLKSMLTQLIITNNELIRIADEVRKDLPLEQLWPTEVEAHKTRYKEAIAECCSDNQLRLYALFQYYQFPNEYDNAVLALGEHITNELDNNFVHLLPLSEAIAQLQQQNQNFKNKIEIINGLANSLDRSQIADQYLQATYRWQNNSFYELERIVPYLEYYATSLRGY